MKLASRSLSASLEVILSGATGEPGMVETLPSTPGNHM
jgi:hypothetical protein